MEFHHIVPHDVDADGEDENPESADPPIWSQVTVSSNHSLFFFPSNQRLLHLLYFYLL